MHTIEKNNTIKIIIGKKEAMNLRRNWEDRLGDGERMM